MSPVRMKGSPASLKRDSHPWLTKLHERGNRSKALQAALLLESVVPWDLSVPSALLAGGDGALLTEQALLELLRRGGEDGLMRGARVFAACDRDRDGGLMGAELLAAAEAVGDDLRAREATLPPGVDVAAVDRLDAATALAWARFSAECLERCVTTMA